MRRRSLYRGMVVALAIGLLAAPVASGAAERDDRTGSWELGWLEQVGGWLGALTSIAPPQDRGPGIDPNGISASLAAGSASDRSAGIDPDGVAAGGPHGADGNCADCGPGIDPDG